MYLKTGVRALTLIAGTTLLLVPAFGQGQRSNRGSVNTKLSYKGVVKMEDGSLAAEKTNIESVCAGYVYRETTTNKKGEFSFWLENPRQDQTTMQGASTASGVTARPLCLIRAVAPGFVSDTYDISARNYMIERSEAENPEIGVLVLHKGSASEALDVSATSEKASKDARKAFDKATKAIKDKKEADAETNLKKAVELYPDYAEAWAKLGDIQMARKQTAEARKSFEAAMKADERFLPPYLQMTTIEAQAGNWTALVGLTDKIITMAPGRIPQAYLVNALANIQLKNLPAAEKSVEAGLKADSKNQTPKLHQLMGSFLANKGDFGGAVKEWEAYLQYSPTASDAEATRNQITQVKARMGAK